MAPAVAVFVMLCLLFAVISLLATAIQLTTTGTATDWFAWALATLCTGTLVCSNVAYWAAHHKVTVGMVMPSIFSLIPATVISLAYTRAPTFGSIALWAILSISVIVLIAYMAGICLLRSAYADAPKPEQDAVIFVLGGSIQGGRPSITLARRLDRAAEILSTSHDCTLVLTGGPVPDDTRCEADYMADYLLEKGIRPESLILERRARNTAQNISYALALIDETDLTRQLCVITSDYHVRRALNEGRRCGVELVPIASQTPPVSRLQQWCREVLVTYLTLA